MVCNGCRANVTAVDIGKDLVMARATIVVRMITRINIECSISWYFS